MKVFIHVVNITCFEEVPYEIPYTELRSDYDIFHVGSSELSDSQTQDLLEVWFKLNPFGLMGLDVVKAANDLLMSRDYEIVDSNIKFDDDFYLGWIKEIGDV